MKISEKDQEIFKAFQQYGKNAKTWMNKCVLMLPEIEKRRIWEKKNFDSIYDFAMKLAGMSRNKVNESLRVLRKIENMPAIKEVVEKKSLWATKPIVGIATPETQGFWADKPNQFQKIELKLTLKTADQLEKIKGKEDREELMQEFQEKLDLIKPRPVRTTSRHIPLDIQRYVEMRAKGRCEEKNCTAPGKHLHHTIPTKSAWSAKITTRSHTAASSEMKNNSPETGKS